VLDYPRCGGFVVGLFKLKDLVIVVHVEGPGVCLAVTVYERSVLVSGQPRWEDIPLLAFRAILLCGIMIITVQPL
jgi:hypothetical protein